jgi:hypothetical protein
VPLIAPIAETGVADLYGRPPLRARGKALSRSNQSNSRCAVVEDG